jgi:hypothetical protein
MYKEYLNHTTFADSIAANGCGQAKLRIMENSTIGKSEFTLKFLSLNFAKSQQLRLFAVSGSFLNKKRPQN